MAFGRKDKDAGKARKSTKQEPDANRDPITGAPGAHPVGSGLGAAGGGLAGGAIGALGGPAGIVAGAAIGGVAGGLAGKGIAEQVNPTAEDAYWREHYTEQEYVEPDASYETYQPAYRYGWESYTRYPGKRFEDVEPQLRSDWEKTGEQTRLSWDRARSACRDAWCHVQERVKAGRGRQGR